MSRRTIRVLGLLALLPIGVALPGCTVASDLLSPDLLSSLGFNPATVSPPAGFVVVVFENNTDQTVEFHLYVAQDATDLTAGIGNLDIPVFPGDLSSTPIRCPIALLSLGKVGDDFMADTIGATVLTAGGQQGGNQTELNYMGSPLIAGAGLDFECGDLIEIELNPITAAAAAAAAAGGQNDAQFTFTIRVIPGR